MEMKQIANSFSLILSAVLFSVISIPATSATALRYHHTLVFNPETQQHETPSRPVQHNPSTTKADPNSLTLELIHRNQLIPHTAVSNINTREALLLSRLERDLLRVEAISNHAAATTQSESSISGPLSSGMAFGTMEYLVRLGVGTPAKQLYFVLDTGSDIVWLQCLPCQRCYNQSDPIFDPKKSTSFSTLSCDSPQCNQLVNTYYEYSNCTTYSKNCLYGAWYGDGSYSIGNFSTETLTFGKAKLKKVAFGCGYNNSGTQRGYEGVLGLSRGNLSFPSQTSHKKFSYCLPSLFTNSSDPPSKSSSITFGDSRIKANFTPLLQNPNSQLNTLYYVGLKGISVGGKQVEGIKPSYLEMDSNGNGGVIVDSGTTYTLLNQNAYKPLREAFVKAMNYTVIATNYAPFDTCYDFSGLEEVTVPTVVLHFDGVDMDLRPDKNYIVMMDSDGTYCFAFLGLGQEGGFSIIGNMIQQGFRVSYDLENNRIGFTPNACRMASG